MHDVVCPEYIDFIGNVYIVLPWFLLPRKKYPAQVYIYAVNLYSTTPGMGQRAAAEATRKEFGLAKFSHSTVCRTFRALEKSLLGTAPDVTANVTAGFPSTSDTAGRRIAMATFLISLQGATPTDGIIEASFRIVVKWYDKYMRLLI